MRDSSHRKAQILRSSEGTVEMGFLSPVPCFAAREGLAKSRRKLLQKLKDDSDRWNCAAAARWRTEPKKVNGTN